MRTVLRSVATAAVVCLAFAAIAPAAPILYRGQPAEVVISRVSPQTLRIVVSPLDPQSGQPLLPAVTTAVLPQSERELIRMREVGNVRMYQTEERLLIGVSSSPLRIVVHRVNGNEPGDGTFVQSLDLSANSGQMQFRARAPILGMGEGAQQFDRRGAEYSMVDGWGAWRRPTHGSWAAVPFLIGTDGWAMLVLNPFGAFDLRNETATFTPTRREGEGDPPREAVEIYLIAWDKPADVLREYGKLVGTAPMPPLWTMGYMQSHRTLDGPGEILQIANTFREKYLPCDALIYLGTGYCPAGWNTGHGSLDFNPATFDRPAEQIKALHDLNYRLVLHVNQPPPRLLTGDDTAPLAAARGRGQRRPLHITDYWNTHRETFALGVDGWWPDDGDELDRESRLARHRMYHEGPLRERPDERPWHLQRTGYAGVARFGGWIWSGDCDSLWRTLQTQVSVGQNHSLSLSPHWGTDIGGFFPTPELSGELYVRWFQFGAFNSLFRSHGRTWHLRLPWGWNTGDPGVIEHNNWRPPESELHNAAVEEICRKYLELRYQLLPYNYSLCREAHETGMPPMRALWLHFSDDPQSVTRGEQFLWGPNLLVAPVIEQGATTRQVYLPPGEWYDFWTNERHVGGREITRPVDLATLPLYVRAGTILPLDPVRQYTSQAVTEPTTLRIYPGADGEFRLYQDDGRSQQYLAGAFAWTKLRWDDAARQLSITADGGELPTPQRARTFRVNIAGTAGQFDVSYDGRVAERELE